MKTPNRQPIPWANNVKRPSLFDEGRCCHGPRGADNGNPQSAFRNPQLGRHNWHRCHILVLVILASLLPAAPAAATNLAVFNFQLKTGQEDWVWLEKFMSDQLATDLVQDRSLSVVARDRMQLMAQQMKWVPEFATTDAKVMGGIRSQLSIEYLVTGVCSVRDDQLEITAQIVEVQTRKEVHRKTVTGKTDQVIDLQKQLSADAMSWFTKRPAGEILKTLPMWTRSIPAVRALYEGMHLYDQGRYAEGWVKFRDASREDKNYVEAVYWVGKMYYFMYRYEHARRELERFVYLNCLHPRMGDAITEYAHTFESSSASPEELLGMYKAFGERFANVVVLGDYGERLLAKNWSSQKSIETLARSGRYRQVAVMTAPVMDDDGMLHGNRASLSSLLRHHALTGEVLPDNVIAKIDWPQVKRSMLHFSPGQARQEYRLAEPARLYGRATESRDKEAIFRQETHDIIVYLLAPSGYVFKSLRFEPVAQGSDAVMTVSLRACGVWEDIDPNTMPLNQARGKGVVFQPVPRLGMLVGRCTFYCKNQKSLGVVVAGVNVTATLEKVSTHGAIDVQCSNMDDFRVDVDGVFARWSSGIVGLLSPGRHAVTFRPVLGHSPYGTVTTEVNVESGKTSRVVGCLPWKDARANASVFTSWLGPDNDRMDTFLNWPLPAPAIQIDEREIRTVWSRDGDLWSAFSTDGNSFSAPSKLPLPVSSAWREWDPRLFRDESGRFVLAFSSNRDGQHRNLAYLCWSRDFVHWSAPALISDIACSSYDVVQGSGGRYICALADTPDDWTTVRLLASPDGYQWNPLPGKPIQFAKAPVRLLAKKDGRIELFAIPLIPGISGSTSGSYDVYRYRTMPAFKQLVRFIYDGQGWSPKEIVCGFTYDDEAGWVSVTNDEHGPVVLATGSRGGRSRLNVRLLREVDGKWESSGTVSGLLGEAGEIAFDSRWGYMIAHGRYVMRSQKLPQLLASAAKDMPKPTIVEPNLLADRRTTWYDAEGRVEWVSIWFTPTSMTPSRSARAPKLPPAKPGELRYVEPTSSGSYHDVIKFEGPEHFRKPKPGSGTVNPDAAVVTTENNGLAISVALDSVAPSAVHYDVLRIDLTGKGEFENAVVVPATIMEYRVDTGVYITQFTTKSVNVRVGDKAVQMPAHVLSLYKEGAVRSLVMFLNVSAEGMCQFGQKVIKVRIDDNNNDLRLGDTVTPNASKACDDVLVYLDHGKTVVGPYGRGIPVDGQLYDIRVAPDGNTVSAKPYVGPAGSLKIDHAAWKAELREGDIWYTIDGDDRVVPLPAGRYTLEMYEEYTSADALRPRYLLTSYRKGHVVDICAGETVTIAVGSPMKTAMTASVSGRTVSFHYTEHDVAGRYPTITLPGMKVQYDVRFLRIVDSRGRSVFGSGMEWSLGSNEWDAKWNVREGLAGTFTATVECDAGPFIPKPATATFTVK